MINPFDFVFAFCFLIFAFLFSSFSLFVFPFRCVLLISNGKKTMLQEEDATSEMDLGDDEDDILTPRQEPTKIPALSLSSDAIVIKTPASTLNGEKISHSMEISPTQSPRRASLSPLASAPLSPHTNPDSSHRNRNQTQPLHAQPPPKLVTRSQTEGQLSLTRKTSESPPVSSAFPPAPLSSPSSLSPSPSASPRSGSSSSATSYPAPSSSPPVRQLTLSVAKLKDFVEKPESQPLSRFEARMALMGGPPKYPSKANLQS
jgi:hypothetical protein